MVADSFPPGISVPQARDDRLTTILLVGRVSSGGRDDLCRVRNISSGGMRIDTLAPLAVGQSVCVELRNGASAHCAVVWTNHFEAGLHFDSPVDIVEFLATARRTKGTTDFQARSPRLSTACPVILRCYGKIVSGVLEDISQGGAKVRVQGTVKTGDQVTLCLPGLAARRASVRFVANATVGISFAETIVYTDLAHWLAGPQRFSSTTAVAATPVRQSS